VSRSPLDIDDLVEHWTLLPDELDLVVRRHEATRVTWPGGVVGPARAGRPRRARMGRRAHAEGPARLEMAKRLELRGEAGDGRVLASTTT